jgi:hypothetical protein
MAFTADLLGNQRTAHRPVEAKLRPPAAMSTLALSWVDVVNHTALYRKREFVLFKWRVGRFRGGPVVQPQSDGRVRP